MDNIVAAQRRASSLVSLVDGSNEHHGANRAESPGRGNANGRARIRVQAVQVAVEFVMGTLSQVSVRRETTFQLASAAQNTVSVSRSCVADCSPTPQGQTRSSLQPATAPPSCSGLPRCAEGRAGDRESESGTGWVGNQREPRAWQNLGMRQTERGRIRGSSGSNAVAAERQQPRKKQPRKRKKNERCLTALS